METLSIGKYRGLQQCTSSRGIFTCLALDHRQNLRRALNPSNPESVNDDLLTQFKLEVTSILAREATAVLLDPQYSAAQAIASNAIPGSIGLVVAVESTGYGGKPTDRQSRILSGWNVAKAKRMGASMIKLLVYYHPDATTAFTIENFVHQVAIECQRLDMGLMLEPLSYSLDPDKKTLESAEKRYVVIEAARRLVIPGVDVLKTEFPLDIATDLDEATCKAACAEISNASLAPWILLSSAIDFETYMRQVAIACSAGASGIAVGRAVWKEAVTMDTEERKKFLRSTARQRLSRLNALCNALGKPWTDLYSPARVHANWYSSYGEIP
ncbi:MAG TPA: hypothetical protein DCK95_10955 [Anaerolineaceae bacterium]|nr:hypothetical protein [Anaerolineaceae bacterium]